MESSNLLNQKCIPCEGTTAPLTEAEARRYLAEVKEWRLENNTIVKDFKFKDFVAAMQFVNSVAKVAEEQGHHPDIFISYNKVRTTLSTHAIKGLSINDFILAAKIDDIH